MTTPPGDEPDSRDGSDNPDSRDALAGEPEAPAEPAFDPYRFGRPDHPIPPEYAPPGYVPDPEPTYQPYPHPYQHPNEYPYRQPGRYQPNGGQYGQPGQYGGPYGGYGHAPMPPQQNAYGTARTGNGKAIASMVLGIMSILLSWLSFIDAIVIVTAIVFGILALAEARGRGGEGRGMAIAGLACAAVGTVAATLLTVFFVHVASQCGGVDNVNDRGFQQCLQDHI